MTEILKTDNLTVGYDRPLIDGICIDVNPGEIVTLIGPNGCGKSTILKTILTQLKAKSGVVFLDGKDMTRMSEADVAKEMSMVMTQKLNTELMTCQEIVEMGRYPYTGRMGKLSENDRQIVSDTMKMLKADEVADRDFNNISDGQRQRVMLARAICQEPEVLVLDEPTSYLDIKYKIEILDVIKKLAKEKNIAVLMSLHELDFAMNMSDKVVAVSNGKIQKMGTPKEIFTEEFIRELYDIKGVELGINESSLWFDGGSHNNAKVIMVQGTMSNAGKSMLVAGLCRIFKQDGYRVAPFKSQNMALNSFVTEEGLEMGRAQVMQAECAGIKPMVCMNPILLKPTDDQGSQVIVNGQVIGNMRAREYFKYKTKLIPDIMKAYNKLCEMADIIVVEGAGSPAEINLKSQDIVNMGLAKMLDAPVLLVGDIDRGGVFAQLMGTLDLLEEEERARVKGLIINKFRGDKSLLDSGVMMLEERGKTDVVGVVPYMEVNLEDEDSLSERFHNKKKALIDIAVIRLPHISNFTDFDVFEQFDQVSVRYVSSVADLGEPDMIILPGTKNTIGDIRWLKDKGLDKVIAKKSEDTYVFGICGGYQMLGEKLSDPDEVEVGGAENGIGLLPVETVLGKEKIRTQFSGIIENTGEELCKLKGAKVSGYEIHMGETRLISDAMNIVTVADSSQKTSKDKQKDADDKICRKFSSANTGYCLGNVYGSYIHGLFDNKEIVTAIVSVLAEKKGEQISEEGILDYKDYKETQFDLMADILREHLDMEKIYKIMGMIGVE